MLGQYNLLPLLKGWEYKTHIAERSAVIRGADPIEAVSVDEVGWLMDIMIITNDAYGTLRVEYQGADLQTQDIDVYPEAAAILGAFQQDPSGWMQLYRRPNPYSTAGAYFVAAFTGGFQGSIWPYYPTVRMKLYLPPDSTQESAYIKGIAVVIAITDKKAFVQSLRRILDPKADLNIDPALLVSGPAEFMEKAKEEKAKE